MEQLDPNQLYTAAVIAGQQVLSETRSQTSPENRCIRASLNQLTKRHGFPANGDGNVFFAGQCPTIAWFGWRWQSVLPIGKDAGENKPILPRCIFRWMGQSLMEPHYSRAGLVMLAKSLGWVKPRHLHHLHTDLRWLMKMAGFDEDHPDLLAHLDGGALPVPGFSRERWACGLMRAAGPPPRCRYAFLVELAADGELHHARTLAKLLTRMKLKAAGLQGSLAAHRDKAYKIFSRIRRDRITVPPQGSLPIPRAPEGRAWKAEVWKSALEIPGYYGFHCKGDPLNEP